MNGRSETKIVPCQPASSDFSKAGGPGMSSILPYSRRECPIHRSLIAMSGREESRIVGCPLD